MVAELLIYMSLLGINLGIGPPFVGSLWAELYGLESLGTVKALLHACSVFSSALSPVIFGYMIDFELGILSLSFQDVEDFKNRKAIIYALITGSFIMGYSITDG